VKENFRMLGKVETVNGQIEKIQKNISVNDSECLGRRGWRFTEKKGDKYNVLY